MKRRKERKDIGKKEASKNPGSSFSYGMVPKGLLTFLGFEGNVEFSPWKRLPEFIELLKS